MRGPFSFHLWTRVVFSLILLVANISAPFRRFDASQALANKLPQKVANSPVVRIRAVTPVGASQGFRVVVGIGKGGSDEPVLGLKSDNLSARIASPTGILSDWCIYPSVTRPHPFLRC